MLASTVATFGALFSLLFNGGQKSKMANSPMSNFLAISVVDQQGDNVQAKLDTRRY